MTIDEAIARERQQAEMHRNDIVPKENYHNMPWVDKSNEGNMRSAEEHEQLASWLEELSRRRVEELFRKTNEKAIRDKAIDDFVNECICYEHLTFEQEHIERIQAIGEQLKAGGENEI